MTNSIQQNNDYKEYNILNCRFLAMHRAISKLNIKPFTLSMGNKLKSIL